MTINVIVAGGRDFTDKQLLVDTLNNFLEGYEKEEVVFISGMARGADSLAAEIAKDNNVALIEMPAQWDIFGKSAGYKRNEAMAELGTHLLAAWDGKSRGTKHMIDIAKRKGLTVRVVNY